MEADVVSTKVCPDCAESVQAAARRCRFCGYRFDALEARAAEGDAEGPTRPIKQKSTFVAGLLSVLVTGAGHLYARESLRGGCSSWASSELPSELDSASEIWEEA
jgi:ribosomal protein L40E